MRRYVFWLSGLAVGLVTFAACTAVWRAAAVLQHTGISSWWPESMRTCHDAPQHPWRNCEQARAFSSTTLADHEQVSFHRITRTISLAQHVWQVRDSVLWQRAADSVRQALTRAGGTRVPCHRFPESDDIASIEAWRFSDHDVRFSTYHLHSSLPSPVVAWTLQVIAMPVGSTGCAPWQSTRKLLTPTQLVAQFQRWLFADEGPAGVFP